MPGSAADEIPAYLAVRQVGCRRCTAAYYLPRPPRRNCRPASPAGASPAGERTLRIAHLNDHYELDLAARYAARLKALNADGHPAGPPLVLHSGDCYAPSLLSVMTKASHGRGRR